MKLGNWFALLGCVGLSLGAVAAAQGCTVTACTGSACNGTSYDYDANFPPYNNDSGTFVGADASLADTGSTAPDPCNTCLYGQCVGFYSNCVGNSSCLAIYQCATSPACAADGGNCVQDCFNAGTSTGQALYLALGECDQAAECTTITPNAACAATCNPAPASCVVPVSPDDAGTATDSAVPPDDAAATADAGPLTCAACLQASCSAQVAACATGTQCATYNQCLGGCADAACDTACTNAYPAGAASAAALGTCTQTSCSQCFN